MGLSQQLVHGEKTLRTMVNENDEIIAKLKRVSSQKKAKIMRNNDCAFLHIRRLVRKQDGIVLIRQM